jgi:MFS family permease
MFLLTTITTKPINGLSSDYWKYWAGQFISNLGSSFTTFGLPLLIFILTGSAVSMGLGFVVGMLPNLLFGLIAGALVDRFDRRLMLILSNLLQGVAIATIPLFSVLHILTVNWIYIVLFLKESGAVFFLVAQFSVIPAIVSQDSLEEANARVQMSSSIAVIAGPIFAGLLINIIPVPSLFLFDAISYIVAIISLLLINKNLNLDNASPTKVGVISMMKDIREGLSYVKNNQLLRKIFLLVMLCNFFFLIPITQIVFFAEKVLKTPNAQIGLIFASQGIGVLILTFFVKKIVARFSFKVMVVGSTIMIGALLIVMSIWHQFWITLLLWAAINALTMLINVSIISLEQRIIPNALFGRVASLDRILSESIMPLGVLVGGIAITATNHADWVFGICGAFMLSIPLPFWLRGFEKSDISKYTEAADQIEVTAI